MDEMKPEIEKLIKEMELGHKRDKIFILTMIVINIACFLITLWVELN